MHPLDARNPLHPDNQPLSPICNPLVIGILLAVPIAIVMLLMGVK